MRAHAPRGGFTLLELLISLSAVSVLLALLLPALSSARVSSRRVVCAANQRQIGEAWSAYLDGSGGRFPVLYTQPGWDYGGVRFSSIDGSAFLDFNRPLNRYLTGSRPGVPGEQLYLCPADRGITDEHSEIGTGRRSAYQAFGTSYRANARLLEPRAGEPALLRDAITTAPSRLVVMGDPVWYESLADTGRRAEWHGRPRAGNLLFLDGSVRFLTIEPQPAVGPAVFDPVSPELLFPHGNEGIEASREESP